MSMKFAIHFTLAVLGLLPLSACFPTGETKACRDLAEKECRADARCVWDSAASPAVCKDKASQQQQKTVYVWKKLKLPHAHITDYVEKFAVSGDNKHLYAYSGSGLYHSADQGQSWKKIGSIDVRPGPDATKSSMECLPSDVVRLQPTEHGVVIQTLDSVCLLEGDKSRWGIRQSFNHDTLTTANAYKVPGFKSQSILFVDVADINGVETIVFGQSPDASTHYNVWLKRTDNGDLPTLVTIKKDDGTAFAPHPTPTMSWMSAGNAHNGDLLLASVSGTKGVWHIPKANLPGGSTWAACPGCVLQNEPVLFPEGAPAAWTNGSGGSSDNTKIMVVGSFSHAGGHHHYFAGLRVDTNEVGGVAHHQDAQGTAHALISFQNTSILGLTKYAGKNRLKTKQGIKGIASDCAPKTDEDILLSAFAQSKDHMMEDGNAVLPFADVSSDERLKDVYGTDDLSWYFVDKDPAGSVLEKDPMAGIFRREKKQGQPRQ